QSALPGFKVAFAMRYQNPSVESGLQKLQSAGCSRIVVVPLFPQYASATNGSVAEEVMRIVKKWMAIPEIIIAGNFHDHPAYINAVASIGRNYNHAAYDHVLFSFHGVPERQIKKTAPQNNCLQSGCCETLHAGNFFCYRAQCFNTARRIAEQLQIVSERYTVCFQSRLGKTPWIQPYANETIAHLAETGAKKVLVFSPAFVADCLETVYEIAVEYNLEFQKAGGEKIQLVESLNANPVWIDALVQIITSRIGSSVA
ncbi:MAG: ferrochelatase, partial [Chitinophagales bacterium]